MLLELKNYIINFFKGMGMSDHISGLLFTILGYLVLIITSYILYKLTVIILRKVIRPIAHRTTNHFDDLLMKNSFFLRISYLAPIVLMYFTLESKLFIAEPADVFIEGMVIIFLYITLALVFQSILSTINDYYNRFNIAKDHPISGIIQVLKIIGYIIALLGIVGYLFDKDISSILLGLGTLSAVLMLIFRDPILGFVGGLQLIFNKMIAIGDWITMPKYGADGTVMEINLTTVKVQNFDKTIITIPTYSLISESFQNWRGMEDSGGRRIKRSINIDMNSVRFCDEKMLEGFSKVDVLASYVTNREKEILTFNKKNKIDTSVTVNGRRQTNIGIFREYLKEYLRERSDIHDDMTFLVRHLQPTEKGLPIQLYVFTTTIDWGEYEDIQADIFDHILAVIPEFNLKVFQYPTNNDITSIIEN